MWLMDKCLNSPYVRIGQQDLAYNKSLCKIPLVVYIYTNICELWLIKRRLLELTMLGIIGRDVILRSGELSQV